MQDIMEDDQSSLLLNTELSPTRKSHYRWVILALFSLLSLLQSGVWDTWGPISPSATRAIGFTEHDYYLLSNWAPIGIMPTMPLFIWLFNKYGIRIPVNIAAFLVALGTGLRCLPFHDQARIIVIHIGQFLSAVAGCVVIGGTPLISNTWFPSGERILATSVMVCVGNTGNALSYLIGPAIVDAPTNCSHHPNSTYATTPNSPVTVTADETELITTPCFDNTEKMSRQIDYYLYGEFAFGLVIFIFTMLLFRNKPALPPTSSAAAKRFDVLVGLRQLSKNAAFWATAISFALVNGAYYGWYGVITILVGPHHVSEADVSQAAFIMTMVGSALGIAVGWFSDRLKGRIKWILFFCYCVMFVTFFFLGLTIMGWFGILGFTHGGFLATFIVLGTFSNVIQPLGFELTADIAYPVSEGASSSIVAWLIMFFMFLFLLILNSIPEQDRDVANYLFLAFVGMAAPILALSTKNENKRVAVDTTADSSDPSIQNDEDADSPDVETANK